MVRAQRIGQEVCSNLRLSTAFYSVVNIKYVDLLETDATEYIQEGISLISWSLVHELLITILPTHSAEGIPLTYSLSISFVHLCLSKKRKEKDRPITL